MYLPGGGLPSEELVVQGAVSRMKLGLQEDAAIGYGLQRGGAFVGEAKPDEQLDGNRHKTITYYLELLEEIITVSLQTLAFLRSC